MGQDYIGDGNGYAVAARAIGQGAPGRLAPAARLGESARSRGAAGGSPEEFPWALGYIVDGECRDTGFAVVRARLTRPDHLKLLAELARDHRIIGHTSQGVFPMIGAIPGNLPDETGLHEGRHEAYLRDVLGWAHCFRNPEDYLPAGTPRILFSNSDNMDPDRVRGLATSLGPTDKRWDFIYTCMPEPSNFVRKNWELAKRCVTRFADEMGLRGVLVGLAGVPDAPEHPLLDLYPQLKWTEFLHCLAQSRVAFFPNTWDPSPRVMGEAMCLDVPLLVNREILGGWKYVCPATGRFFTSEVDVVDAMAAIRSEPLEPRAWYCENYGAANAGPRLASFLRRLPGGDTQLETAFFYGPRDWGVFPKPAALKVSA